MEETDMFCDNFIGPLVCPKVAVCTTCSVAQVQGEKERSNIPQ